MSRLTGVFPPLSTENGDRDTHRDSEMLKLRGGQSRKVKALGEAEEVSLHSLPLGLEEVQFKS